MRAIRNCHNRRRVKHPILRGRDEWLQVSASLLHVLKIGDVKFFECPVSAVSRRTWERIRVVNESALGEHMEQLYLPDPGTILDQPPWWREAVRIVRAERAEHRFRELEKLKK